MIHYDKGINRQLNWGRNAAFINSDELSPFQNETNLCLGRIIASRAAVEKRNCSFGVHPRLSVMARSWKIIHDHGFYGFFGILLRLSWKIMDGPWQGMAPWIIIHDFDP